MLNESKGVNPLALVSQLLAAKPRGLSPGSILHSFFRVTSSCAPDTRHDPCGVRVERFFAAAATDVVRLARVRHGDRAAAAGDDALGSRRAGRKHAADARRADFG